MYDTYTIKSYEYFMVFGIENPEVGVWRLSQTHR